jgi:2-polyprenyl-6-methoxyphenol hydroxylase-like FAD-dependent oxidoreductase
MKSILVSGASIAGLTLAHWLPRYGFSVTVVERGPSPRPGGQAVDLRGAAREVAERMGIMPQIRSASIDERGLAYVDETGRRRASMPADLFGGEGAVAEIEILRGDLTDILYAGAERSVEYLFDDSITALTETRNGLHVSFERHAPRTFDLVIGADGLHSNVRKLTFGPEQDFVQHLGAYTAYFTIPAHGLALDHWFLLHSAPGGRVAAIRPEGGRAAKAMFSFTATDLVYDRHDRAQLQQILAERFSDMGWHTPRLLAAMPRSDDFFFDAISQVHMRHYARGRVALVGDAAYCGSPLSGNGTAMAMVGAYVLAGELAATGGEHTTAFARYQELMRPYVAECQKLPPGGIGGFLPKSGAAIRMRNVSVKIMTSRLLRGLMARAAQKADSITLADYGTDLVRQR